ncbi:hypothetical protein K7I03_00025 [Streptomyces mobaraensis]|nr:hypothetical protein [Streptomyces sp. TYQ1024]UBI40905.1 hypothetical protein K7I03_00025 [Streptomyces mobaraensis]
MFDGAWTNRVLQHAEEPDHTLEEVLRVVRPGDRIALSHPDTAPQALNIEDHRLATKIPGPRQTASTRHNTFTHRPPPPYRTRPARPPDPGTHPTHPNKRTTDDTTGIHDRANAFTKPRKAVATSRLTSRPAALPRLHARAVLTDLELARATIRPSSEKVDRADASSGSESFPSRLWESAAAAEAMSRVVRLCAERG